MLILTAEGHVLSMNDADMHASGQIYHYTYDALGNLTSSTDPKGQVICQYFDLLNRMTGKYYPPNGSCPTM